MELQDGISKFLTALSDDNDLQQKVAEDPEAAVRSVLGDDLDENDMAGLVKGTSKLFSDKTNATGFLGLLSVKDCIPGLSELLTQKGGLSIITKYISGSMKDGKAPIQSLGIMTELLSAKGGTAALKRLIGMKGDLPDLSSMMAMLSGSGGEPVDPKKPKKTGDAVLDALGSIFKL